MKTSLRTTNCDQASGPENTDPDVACEHHAGETRNLNPGLTILYYDHTASLSGGELALLNLLQALDRSRYTPLVVLGTDGPLVARLKDLEVETYVLLLDNNVAQTRKDSLKGMGLLRLKTFWKSLLYILRLAHLIRGRSVDLVHTNSLKADILGGIAARLAKVPVIWHVRDRIADDYLPTLAAYSFRILCRLIPGYIIANSQSTENTLMISDTVRVKVIYSGATNTLVEPTRGRIPDPGLPPAFASSLGSPRIGLVGRISPWKGQHIFIAAAAEVVKRFPNAHFQIIGSAMFGEAEYETQVRQQVQRLGLSGQVEFTGFCEDVYARIQDLDILVHASTIGEPFGQVVVEGMVSGKPVVATNGGGVPEIVVDGETGLLVPMGDASAMGEAICELLSDPKRAERMGMAARTRALEMFTMERTAEQVHAVYDLMSTKQPKRGNLARN